MTASELLAELRTRGVRLWADGADARFSDGNGGLDPVAQERVGRHQTELVEVLKSSRAHDQHRVNGSAGKLASALERGSIASGRDHQPQQVDAQPAPSKNDLCRRLGMDKRYVRGDGCYVYDSDGTRYADFAQSGAIPFGHNPGCIWQALEKVRQESEPHLPAAPVSATAGELAKCLLALAPAGLDRIAFTPSGAAAIESAIMVARARTGRMRVLSARAGLHGHPQAGSSAIMAFKVQAPDIVHVPFGHIEKLQGVLAAEPDSFAALLVEIIRVDAGMHVLPPGYLAAALDLCRRFGVLLIVDETQTGLARTGTLLACEAENVTPDMLVLGDALGGGLVSIGACLYSALGCSDNCEIPQHPRAASALAYRAALATIAELTQDDQCLVRRAAALGESLHRQLQELKRQFPMLVAAVRGRGLMLEMEFALEHIEKTQGGMLAIVQSHGTLLDVVLSYLLNAEHIRVAASSAGTGIRIEAAATADTAFCEHLIGALRRVLNALQRGDAGELLAHLMEGARGRNVLRVVDAFQRCDAKVLLAHLVERARSGRVPRRKGNARADMAHSRVSPRLPRSEGRCNRFAYVVHLVDVGDMRRFDPSLERFTDVQVEQFRRSMAGFLQPFPLDKLVVHRPDGSFAEGELIMLPFLPAELLAMLGKQAVDLVQSAVDLGVARGARVVGLGGFSSIISYGGNALEQRERVTVTSGNSLTTWAALRSVELACAQRGLALANCTVAIVGANGAIGHALSKLFAERARELILVGNPRNPEASLRKLRRVANDCRRHVTGILAQGRTFSPGSLAAEIASRPASEATHDPELAARITLTTDIDEQLPRANIVLTATKEVLPFIKSRQLRQGGLVCDVSRPFNVAPEVFRTRPDLRLVSGGLIKAPESSILGYIEERDRPKVLLSCAAETIMLALSGYQSRHLCGHLEIDTIESIGRQAESFGFSVVE